jgi:hypothetical protein
MTAAGERGRVGPSAEFQAMATGRDDSSGCRQLTALPCGALYTFAGNVKNAPGNPQDVRAINGRLQVRTANPELVSSCEVFDSMMAVAARFGFAGVGDWSRRFDLGSFGSVSLPPVDMLPHCPVSLKAFARSAGHNRPGSPVVVQDGSVVADGVDVIHNMRPDQPVLQTSSPSRGMPRSRSRRKASRSRASPPRCRRPVRSTRWCCS